MNFKLIFKQQLYLILQIVILKKLKSLSDKQVVRQMRKILCQFDKYLFKRKSIRQAIDKTIFNNKNIVKTLQNQSHHYLYWLIFGFTTSLYLSHQNITCNDTNPLNNKSSNDQSQTLPQDSHSVQIFQLNKNDLVKLLSSIHQQSILIIFNKYFRNQKQKQFTQKLEEVYKNCQKLKINKIFLIDQNDVRHLEKFQKMMKYESAAIEEEQEEKSQKPKLDYYYLTPSFKNTPFHINQDTQITKDVNQIRKYSIKINPQNFKQQIFYPYQKIFNTSTIIKQCPQFVSSNTQNQCIQKYRQNIATLIDQKMLKNKSDQYRFYAFTPKTKKDNSLLVNLNKQLNRNNFKQILQEQTILFSQKQQNTFILRNDMLGKQIDSIKQFKKKYYKEFKSLNSYDKFLLFIKPRIFVISRTNFQIDLYWYVTCFKKNNQPTISINNTDSFLSGRKVQITNGLSYPKNNDLQFLKILYKNHPELNYTIVNTENVAELIRHIPTRNKYVIFNLTMDLIYPKMFLPTYDQKLSPQENYQQKFKSLIQRYLKEPKVYDKIVLDKEKKVGPKQFKQLINQKNRNSNQQKFVLRVCNIKCQNDLQEQKLKKAFDIITAKTEASSNQDKKVQNSLPEQNKIQNSTLQKQKHWKNRVYQRTYWIDSYFNNVGLNQGEYIFSNGKFQQL